MKQKIKRGSEDPDNNTKTPDTDIEEGFELVDRPVVNHHYLYYKSINNNYRCFATIQTSF